MLWITWRQTRIQILLTFGLLAVLGGWILINGLGSAGLPAGPGPVSSREQAEINVLLQDHTGALLSTLNYIVVVPVLVGVFWGAPLLAREYEAGTYRFAWTQSIPRVRWVLVKLGSLGSLVVLAGLVLGAMTTWWSSRFPGHMSVDRFNSGTMFGLSGVAPAGWWLFAFCVGVAAGALIRRTVPALAVTAAVVIAVMIGLMGFARDHYAEPILVDDEHAEITRSAEAARSESVLLGPDGAANAVMDQNSLAAGLCPDSKDDAMKCLRYNGYRFGTEYQPADRYWRFQWTETGVLALGAIGAVTFAVRRTSRRPV